MKAILLTGGAGYIGSHMYLYLKSHGYYPIILDNFLNSKKNVLLRLKMITNEEVLFKEGNINDEQLIINIIQEFNVEAIIHFAALKSVEESNLKPLYYFNNNVNGFFSVLSAMEKTNCYNIILSSSACVYGNPISLPVREDHPINPINAYGQTKAMCEKLLISAAEANEKIKYCILRYFNPVGAHSSSLIGEDPLGTPNNLMPYLSQVATGKFNALYVYGDDYDTCDGTGVRDYIHIDDLVEGHYSSLDYLNSNKKNLICNLGTGKGYSVLKIAKVYEDVSGKKINLKFMSRREGDIDCSYADVTKASNILNWSAKKDLIQMCESSWKWQSENPLGYDIRNY